SFDVLNHAILLIKLSRYGVRGVPLALLQSYLANGKPSVVIDSPFLSFFPMYHKEVYSGPSYL
ncbi:hypothetical protein HPB47_027621, partial [Ixodes persulcatus]